MINPTFLSLTVIWKNHVLKLSVGSNCTLSHWNATVNLLTSTLCMAWESYHKDLPGESSADWVPDYDSVLKICDWNLTLSIDLFAGFL